MEGTPGRLVRDGSPHAKAVQQRHVVLIAGLLLILLQLMWRAWALYPSWFFTDDYRLMYDSLGVPLSWDYLADPFDSHFMPLGRLLVWVVVESGPFAWFLAASLTLTMQLLANLACLWMATTLFGVRWQSLALLAIYLTTAITIPAFMWWAAAVNQLPLQAATFAAIACWTRYLSSGRRRWAWGSVAALVAGVLAYEKALLLVPVLVAISLFYFATGSLPERLRDVVVRWWPGLVGLIVVAGAYAGYYLVGVPQPFEELGQADPGAVADAMLATALPTGTLGGPWLWWETSPPLVLALPPRWAVHVSWVVLSLAVTYSVLRRVRAGRGWVLLACYSVVLYMLLAASRGQLYGALAGLEYRYLTDVAPILVLTLGLVFLGLQGAPDASAPRERPLLTVSLGPRWTGALVVAICLGGVVSSTEYVWFWHHRNAGSTYVATLRDSLAAQPAPPEVVDYPVPVAVMPEYTQPGNQASQFLRLFDEKVSFPEQSHDLQIIDEHGWLRPVQILVETRSETGPAEGCGWLVSDEGAVDLDGVTPDGSWWMRIGYLSSAETPATVSAGESSVPTVLRPGLHSLFVKAEGAVSSVRIDDLDDGVGVCVDVVEVGTAVPALEAGVP